MNVKNQLTELNEKYDRLTGMHTHLKEVKTKLQAELDDICSRLGSMEKERAARLADFIDGTSEAYNPSDEVEYASLSSVMVVRKNEISPALIKIETDIKDILSERQLLRDKIDRVVSKAWLDLLDEDMPQLIDTLERVFALLDGVKVHNNVPNYGAAPSLQRLKMYLEHKGINEHQLNFKKHKDTAQQRFYKKHGIYPQLGQAA